MRLSLAAPLDASAPATPGQDNTARPGQDDKPAGAASKQRYPRALPGSSSDYLIGHIDVSRHSDVSDKIYYVN